MTTTKQKEEWIKSGVEILYYALSVRRSLTIQNKSFLAKWYSCRAFHIQFGLSFCSAICYLFAFFLFRYIKKCVRFFLHIHLIFAGIINMVMKTDDEMPMQMGDTLFNKQATKLFN